jgi:peptide/nickel transport system permease protein
LLASLTQISSAPSWVHGVILLAIFALGFQILPFKGIYDGLPPETTLETIKQVSKHMVLPVIALILNVFFQSVYTWRTFFMVHSGEDYVELAHAKGLSNQVIRKQYMLRPTLPSIITSFAMMLIGFWQGAIALELLFEWPGLGNLFFQAIYAFDRPVVVGIVVMFAYLLGFSVIFLDVLYGVIDPRVRLGRNGVSARMRSVTGRSPLESIKPFFLRLIDWVKSPFRKNNGVLGERKPPMVSSSEEDTQPVHTNLSLDNSLALAESEETQSVFAVPDKGNLHRSKALDGDPSIKRAGSQKSWVKNLVHQVRGNIFKYPMAAVGIVIVIFLILVSIVTVIAIPHDEAVQYWRSEGYLTTPRLARPSWSNLFRRVKLPESLYFNSSETTKNVVFSEERVPINEELTDIRMEFEFEFTADDFPQDLVIMFDTTYNQKVPFVALELQTPDGREQNLASFKATNQLVYRLLCENPVRPSTSRELTSVQKAFGDPAADYLKPLKGQYTFRVLSVIFDEESDVAIEGTLHGKVYGLFGTDNQRRDLTIAMLWGTPVALTFGVVGAVVTTVSTILISAFSAWYGGIVDEILQRITELNIILPALPIAVMVYNLYSKSIWVILAIMVLMNVFGNSLKEYRAMFLQFKEAPYIEAAMAYGATNRRIIFTYMLPRIIQVMVPQLVISVPSFVFLEATLAYLGVVTRTLPTWGKVINMALNNGAFWGIYYWVLEPIVLVMITGLAFAFVGFALDKILNPRLRNL